MLFHVHDDSMWPFILIILGDIEIAGYVILDLGSFYYLLLVFNDLDIKFQKKSEQAPMW